ncbi:MAG: MFS transporter [Firmicutes bacterium]|nr:MFS transporter [Bacillota bacterium]
MAQQPTTKPQKSRSRDGNYYGVLIDGAFYFTAATFAAPATVIPAFARELGASALIIGLAPTLYSLGWMLPQLFSAHYVQRLTRKKPYILSMMGAQRLCYLIIALLTWLIPIDRPQVLLITFLAVYLLASIFDGTGTPAWLEFVASSIPERRRGSLFAARTFISCICGLVAGWLTRLTLEQSPFPQNFGLLFLWAFLLFATGWTVFARLTWEQPSEGPNKSAPSLKDYLRRVPGILTNDSPFRRFVLAMMLLLLGQMGLAFFSVYGLERMALPASYVGYFTISMTTGQMLAALFAGRLGDARGHKINLQLSCIAMGAAAFLTSLPPKMSLTVIIFVLLGIANTTYGVSRLPIVMEYAPEGLRSVYAGIVNTLLAPVVFLTPMIGGWLVEVIGYGAVFKAALAINGLAIVFFIFLVQDPRKLQRDDTIFSQNL